MRLERTALIFGAFALVAAGWCAGRAHALQAILVSARPATAAPLQPSVDNLEARLKKLESASPGLGDIMNGIQLHFSKLYFASEARNWDLARFERGEVEEGLEKLAALRPQENGVNIAGIAGAFKETQLVALKDAIEMKDRAMFRDAYQQSMQMCNTCHQSTGRPFIMIMTPTNPPVANQRWEAALFAP
jgi:cytochrome c556